MQFLIPKARNLRTGQTVKQQDLTGRRYMPQERSLVQQQADILARSMAQRGQDQWLGFVDVYTVPTVKNS